MSMAIVSLLLQVKWVAHRRYFCPNGKKRIDDLFSAPPQSICGTKKLPGQLSNQMMDCQERSDYLFFPFEFPPLRSKPKYTIIGLWQNLLVWLMLIMDNQEVYLSNIFDTQRHIFPCNLSQEGRLKPNSCCKANTTPGPQHQPLLLLDRSLLTIQNFLL